MNRLNNSLTIKSRLLLMMLAVSLISSLIIGFLGWQTGRNALDHAIESQLLSIRSSRAYQIETYFDRIFAQTRTLAEDRMVVNAMQSFRVGYGEALERTLTPEEYDAIETYYADAFLPRLSVGNAQGNLLIRFISQRQVANYFQYHYMVNNQFPVGQKDELVLSTSDTTTYSRFHEFYHPIFRNLLYEFGYYDIFLIDLESGNIVYSVFKEVDYATSLTEGPYSESGLGILASQIRAQPERDKVVVVDFRSYEPSYGAPAAFVGAPIFDGNTAIGILALQLPVDEINSVMTGGAGWATDGLGETGETFLVGSDGLMRSVSRRYIENPAELSAVLRSNGASDLQLDNIDSFGTTVMQLPVVSEAVDQAFSSVPDTILSSSYHSVPVLSSFERLEIDGLDWAILAEIEQDEAFRAITDMQRRLLLWTVSLIMMVAFAALLLARGFLRPIEVLNESVKAINRGDETAKIDVTRSDEIGELGESFQNMFTNLREQRAVIETQAEAEDALLNRVLPDNLVERFKAGEPIADSFQQVSLVFIHLHGFSALSNKRTPYEQSALLDTIYTKFDEIAATFEMDRVKTYGETYTAACGLRTARLDHSKRAVSFSKEAIKSFMGIVAQYDLNLSLQIGVSAGSVHAALLGNEHLGYEVWGEPVNTANRIHIAAAPNTVLVTDDVKLRVETQFGFTAHDPILVAGAPAITVHELILESTGDTGALKRETGPLSRTTRDGGTGK